MHGAGCQLQWGCVHCKVYVEAQQGGDRLLCDRHAAEVQDLLSPDAARDWGLLRWRCRVGRCRWRRSWGAWRSRSRARCRPRSASCASGSMNWRRRSRRRPTTPTPPGESGDLAMHFSLHCVSKSVRMCRSTSVAATAACVVCRGRPYRLAMCSCLLWRQSVRGYGQMLKSTCLVRGLPVTPRGAYADAAAPNTGAASDDDADDAGPSSGRRRGRVPKRKLKNADTDGGSVSGIILQVIAVTVLPSVKKPCLCRSSSAVSATCACTVVSTRHLCLLRPGPSAPQACICCTVCTSSCDRLTSATHSGACLAEVTKRQEAQAAVRGGGGRGPRRGAAGADHSTPRH